VRAVFQNGFIDNFLISDCCVSTGDMFDCGDGGDGENLDFPDHGFQSFS
jgi:hypothetical protein